MPRGEIEAILHTKRGYDGLALSVISYVLGMANGKKAPSGLGIKGKFLTREREACRRFLSSQSFEDICEMVGYDAGYLKLKSEEKRGEDG